MMPASSNNLTVRYTVEIEILSSTATQRRYNSSTSGWSKASASTRAITRRCSVMRMPVAAQRASMPVAFGAGGGFRAVMGFVPWGARSVTSSMLRQVAAHQKRIQLFPVWCAIIAFAASDRGEAGPFIEPPCRRVVFLDLQKDAPHAVAGEMAEMGDEEFAREPAAAIGGVDRNRKDLGLVRAQPRDRKADGLSSEPQAMHQRVALGNHAFELALAPAAMKGGAVKLSEPRRVAQGRRFDRWLAAGEPGGPPRHHEAAGCEPITSCDGFSCEGLSCEGLASGARR